jgi:hypothetical protein
VTIPDSLASWCVWLLAFAAAGFAWSIGASCWRAIGGK